MARTRPKVRKRSSLNKFNKPLKRKKAHKNPTNTYKLKYFRDAQDLKSNTNYSNSLIEITPFSKIKIIKNSTFKRCELLATTDKYFNLQYMQNCSFFDCFIDVEFYHTYYSSIIRTSNKNYRFFTNCRMNIKELFVHPNGNHLKYDPIEEILQKESVNTFFRTNRGEISHLYVEHPHNIMTFKGVEIPKENWKISKKHNFTEKMARESSWYKLKKVPMKERKTARFTKRDYGLTLGIIENYI